MNMVANCGNLLKSRPPPGVMNNQGMPPISPGPVTPIDSLPGMPPLGSTMGTSIGSNMGSTMGSNMGTTIGSNMGSAIGSNMGSAIGSNMGSAIGSNMGSAIGSNMGSAIGSNMGSAIGSNMGSAIGSNMGSAIGSNMGSAIGSNMGSNIGSTMGSTMGSSAPSMTTPNLHPFSSNPMGSSFGQPPQSPQKTFPMLSGPGPNLGGLINPTQSSSHQSSLHTNSQSTMSQPPKSSGAIRPGDISNIWPELNQSFSPEIDEEANSYFQQIYNQPPNPIMSVDDVLQMLKQFKDSQVTREREVFMCMLRNLFEEYKFFPQYPERELLITACLFGGVIEQGLVTFMALGMALRYVLEALRKPHNSKMYMFGIAALDKFKLRLKDFAQYCTHVASIPHFKQFPEHLIEGLMRSSSSPSSYSWSSWGTFTQMFSVQHLFVFSLLLLMAGDVELNPGPLELPPVSQIELRALAEEVSHDYYEKLGLHLGCIKAKLDNLLRDEQRTEKATFAMLCCWWNDTIECERRERLVEALSKCRLKDLADKVAQGTFYTEISSKKQDATEEQDATGEQIEQCKKDLMEELAVTYCQLLTKPLDPDTLIELNEIYTNLILLSEDTKSKSSQPLKYEDILNNKINNVLLHRVLVQGEAGVGKTTLLSKIINDWIQGTHFQKFKLVLPVRLREVKDGKTIGEIVKSSYLPDNKVTAMQLNNYIRNNPEKVLILLDGYDELTRDLSTETSILKILECKEYKKCFVIITSRPWKVKHIRNDTELRKRYAFVEIKGFTRENVKEYVSRFFRDDKEPAESLVKFMEKGSLIAENISPYPIFCAMLCHLWKEEDRREVVQRLQTFSQLFQEIMGFMEDSYLDKHPVNLRSRFKMALRKNLLQLAEVAFEGLMERNLVFSEDRFDKEVLQTGDDVGLLSRDKKQPGRSERKKPRMRGEVFFPHKLFQEYLAGLHLAEQAKTNPEKYVMLLDVIFSKNRDEMKFLLFFAAAQEKQVALDITSGLVNILEQSSVRSTTGVEATAHKFIVDVVFESFNQGVAREVERSFCSLSRMTELEVDNDMSAHTVAGYFYTFKSLESVVFLKRSYGHTLSSELADKVCTLPTLQRVVLKKASFREVFYMVFEKEARGSWVKSFTIDGILIESSTSSGQLARGLCAMPHLDSLILHSPSLQEDFYSVMASCAHSAQIKELHLADLSLESEPDISKSIARAIRSMAGLKKLILSDWIVLHDAFYTELAANASSTQIEGIELSDLKLKTEKRSHDLAVCVNAMPCLNSLVVVKETELHPHFFSKSAALSQENGQDENQSTGGKRDFSLTLDDKTADAWCKHKLVSIMPDLSTFILRCGRTVDTKTLNQASLRELQELHIQPALSVRDPTMSDSDSFSRIMMSSFPGLRRLVLTNISLGNQKSKNIIMKLKGHPSIQSISFIQCHTIDHDPQMDALCKSARPISVTMEHGERQKM